MDLVEIYDLPKTTRGKISFLCRVLDMPYDTFDTDGKHSQIPDTVATEILSGIVLYHHLSRIDKQKIMETIHKNLTGRRAISFVISKITDPIVNPMWGLWSKPTSEIITYLEQSEEITSWLSKLGIGISLPSLLKLPATWNKSPATVMLGLLMWGFYQTFETDRKLSQEEIIRRTKGR